MGYIPIPPLTTSRLPAGGCELAVSCRGYGHQHDQQYATEYQSAVPLAPRACPVLPGANDQESNQVNPRAKNDHPLRSCIGEGGGYFSQGGSNDLAALQRHAVAEEAKSEYP
jgi:hypothetical protein